MKILRSRSWNQFCSSCIIHSVQYVETIYIWIYKNNVLIHNKIIGHSKHFMVFYQIIFEKLMTKACQSKNNFWATEYKYIFNKETA